MAKRKSAPSAETAEAQAADSTPGRILEDYLTELKAIHGMGGGVAETSYYPALRTCSMRWEKRSSPKSAA